MKKEISPPILICSCVVLMGSFLYGLWYFAAPHPTKKVSYSEMSPVQKKNYQTMLDQARAIARQKNAGGQ